jgi:hypothetical protein
LAELIPISLYTRALEQTIATLKRSPWIAAVPAAAIGLGTLADWLLAPLLNLGLIIAAPIKGLLWAIALHVLRRAVVDETLSRLEIEAELVSRMRSFSALAAPLLLGSVAFLTLAYGGFLSLVFVLAIVSLPLLEWALFGSQRGLPTFLQEHGKAWAVTHVLGTAFVVAVWLVVVMVTATVHVLAGEVMSAVVGGPLVTLVWLIRGHAFLILDAPAPVAPAPVKAAPKKATRPAPATGSKPVPPKRPAPKR